MGLFDLFISKNKPQNTTAQRSAPSGGKKPASRTAAVRSGVDCYSYHGSVEDYFADVLSRNFPDYQIRRNVTLESIHSAGGSSSVAAPAGTWKCSCGSENKGAFCPNCGSKKPEPKPVTNAGPWVCSCGAKCTGKFCIDCGSPRPVSREWICSCGAKNEGKFCPECGSRKPEASAPVHAAPAVSTPASAGKSTGFALSYVLYQSGMPKMAVILCPKNSYKRKDILQAMDGCKGKGIPCLRFFREFRNDEAYIRSRISQTLR